MYKYIRVMKSVALLISIFISLFCSISFAETSNNEPSLSEKIKNSHYHRLDSSLWNFFENINFNDLIKDNKWTSSLNFKRSVIDYYDNKGVLIDTTSLPIAWNIANKNIKNLLPENLPSDLSVALNYNFNFGLIVQRILVIPKKEEFKKQKRKDWVSDIHKELLQVIETSPFELKRNLRDNISNANSLSGIFDNIDINPATPKDKQKRSWKQRASDHLVKKWNNFLYQLHFDFSEIQYQYFFSRFLHIFKIPIKANLAKKMSMQETLSYTTYGVHTLGPSFSYKANLNLNINLNPFYVIRTGQFKVQVLRLDHLNTNKILLKFSHLVSKGNGSKLEIDNTSYLVKKVKDTLHLTGGNFFKKALVYNITPILNFSKNQANLSIEEKTQSYEFDLSHPDAVKAYNYAAIGMTHKTEEIIENLKFLGASSPVKIRQRSQLNGTHNLTSFRVRLLGSSYKWERNCEKQFNQTHFSFKKENKHFLDIGGNIFCNERSSLNLLSFFSLYDEKEINYLSSGVLEDLDTSDEKKELYINAVYAYEFKNYEKNNTSNYYNSVRKQIEYFNLVSNKQIKLPCPKYKFQKKQAYNNEYNWDSIELLEHNKNVDQCMKEHFKNIKIQLKISYSSQDIKNFYLQKSAFITKAIQTAFQEYINSSILLDIKNTPYLKEEELAEKIKQYETNLAEKDIKKYNFVTNALNNQYRLLEKILIKSAEITIWGLEKLGLPYSKEFRLEPAMKHLFTSWKTLKHLSQQPKLDTKKMANTFYKMFAFPEFSKEYIHFLSIISNYKAVRALYLKQDGKQLLNKEKRQSPNSNNKKE